MDDTGFQCVGSPFEFKRDRRVVARESLYTNWFGAWLRKKRTVNVVEQARGELRVSWHELFEATDEEKRCRQFHDYHLYGICVRSEIPLAHVAQLKFDLPDVTLFRTAGNQFARLKASLPTLDTESQWSQYIQCPDGCDYLCWRELFEFLVSPDGRQILCGFLEKATGESFRTYLLGQVLSYALIKRGFEPLHATAVVVRGEAVAFLGDSGFGKSTLAAAFLRAGQQMLTDDVLVVRDIGGRLYAFPGPPRIKLFPEVARQLLPDEATRTPMNPGTSKLIIRLAAEHVRRDAVPLRGFFILGDPDDKRGAGVHLADLTGTKALIALVRGTFNARVLDRKRLHRQFLAARDWSSKVPVRCVRYPRTLEALEDVRNLIVHDRRIAG